MGAGPGAPDLLTQRGARAIATADIVIWASSLVDQRILAHASEHAEIVDSAQLPMEGVLPYYERAAHHDLTVARDEFACIHNYNITFEQTRGIDRLEAAIFATAIGRELLPR